MWWSEGTVKHLELPDVVSYKVAEPGTIQPDSGSLPPKGPALHPLPDWRAVSFPKTRKGPWIQEAGCVSLRLPEGPKPDISPTLHLPDTPGRDDLLHYIFMVYRALHDYPAEACLPHQGTRFWSLNTWNLEFAGDSEEVRRPTASKAGEYRYPLNFTSCWSSLPGYPFPKRFPSSLSILTESRSGPLTPHSAFGS